MKKAIIFFLCLLPYLTLKAQQLYYIQSSDGRYLTILNNNQNSGTPVMIGDFIGDDAQKWTITQSTLPNQDHIFYIKSRNGLTLDISFNGSGNGTPIKLWPFDGNSAQVWKFDSPSGDLTTELACIIQAGFDTRTLDFCSSNKQIYIWEYNATPCQRWKIKPCPVATPPPPPVVSPPPNATTAPVRMAQTMNIKRTGSVYKVTPPVYKTWNWTEWVDRGIFDQRKNFGLRIADANPQTQLDVMYEVRNRFKEDKLHLEMQIYGCGTEANKLLQTVRWVVEPQKTQEFKAVVPNCGTPESPKPNCKLNKTQFID